MHRFYTQKTELFEGKQFDLRRLQDFLRFGNFCLTMVIMYATITPEFGKKGESRYVEQRVCHCECNLP